MCEHTNPRRIGPVAFSEEGVCLGFQSFLVYSSECYAESVAACQPPALNSTVPVEAGGWQLANLLPPLALPAYLRTVAHVRNRDEIHRKL